MARKQAFSGIASSCFDRSSRVLTCVHAITGIRKKVRAWKVSKKSATRVHKRKANVAIFIGLNFKVRQTAAVHLAKTVTFTGTFPMMMCILRLERDLRMLLLLLLPVMGIKISVYLLHFD